MPPFQGVLSKDVAEFLPYVFQLLAELLARDQDPASAAPWRRQLKAIAAERIGAPGGSERMAAAILAAVRNGAPGRELPPPLDPGT